MGAMVKRKRGLGHGHTEQKHLRGRMKRDWKTKNSLSFPTEGEIHIIKNTRECEKEVAFCNTQIIITHSVLWEKHGRKAVGGRVGWFTLRMHTVWIPRKTHSAYPEQGLFSFPKLAMKTAPIVLDINDPEVIYKVCRLYENPAPVCGVLEPMPQGHRGTTAQT